MKYLEQHQVIDHLITQASLLKAQPTLASRLHKLMDQENLHNIAMNEAFEAILMKLEVPSE